MKRLALAVSVLGISVASAMAADLPIYSKAPPVAAVYDWSGIYIGGNGGYGWASNCWNLNQDLGVVYFPAVPEGCSNATGGAAGGQFGYRFQTGHLVVGMDAQFDWADLSGSNTSLFLPGVTNQSKMNAFGLYTGHFGWAENNALFYVKSGLAVTDNKYSGLVTATNTAFDQASEPPRVGYAVGAGFEYGFAPNWSAAIEYNHFFMNQSANNLNFIGTGVYSRTDTNQQDVDMVTVKVNYHFGLGGPVVAKY